MRLATITNWAYGATLVLTLSSGVTMLLASDAHERERAAVADRHALQRATTDLGKNMFLSADHARQFVVTGDPVYRILHYRTGKALSDVEAGIAPLAKAGALPNELRTLREAIRWSQTMGDQQRAAILAYRRGDRETAQRILFGEAHQRELDRAKTLLERFEMQIETRTANQIETATRFARLWRTVSEIVLATTALLFLAVLYFIFKRRVLRPVVRLSDVVTRLAAQDFSAVPPQIDQIDEIGDMAQAIHIFRANGLERLRLEAERDRDLAVRDTLARMTQRMQGCDDLDGLIGVALRFAPEIAPDFAGRLYLMDIAAGELRAACEWLAPVGSRDGFPASACWALRRGQPHRPAGGAIDVPCLHLAGDQEPTRDTLCLPLTAHGEILGLLYLEPRQGEPAAAVAMPAPYLYMLAENIGLALANLRLREALRAMAMVDALTGLSNRRQLEERLAGLLSTSGPNRAPLSCLMIDVDHFKRFNDTYGHDAGDAVLRAVGKVLADGTRGVGDAFRYGGEEFTILLPVDAEHAAERAERIRARVAELEVRHDGNMVGPVTISIGLAAAPEHVAADQLIATADAALLRAKQQGRNRVEIAKPRHRHAA
ncbi:diguanylate cyclase [Sphingomonas sp. R647]|uniref:sensor domain-containing diguanylate cyclase n=1 Tax=Sphingomonas sp. R647 TaxID=2875233 RepID=UPI00296E87D7|nr:diguanylate cyclase [Sphingomonas sp. R647]